MLGWIIIGLVVLLGLTLTFSLTKIAARSEVMYRQIEEHQLKNQDIRN
ncbi:hypothetical protein [Weissella muntiaci]|nr:hypothetical protein [Weissella muntiaci]